MIATIAPMNGSTHQARMPNTRLTTASELVGGAGSIGRLIAHWSLTHRTGTGVAHIACTACGRRAARHAREPPGPVELGAYKSNLMPWASGSESE